MTAVRPHRDGRRGAWTSLARAASLLLICMPFWSQTTAQTSHDPLAESASAALKPGDRIRVRIWREPDLSGEFALPPDGVVDFPRIGRIPVGQLSIDSLRALLTARYAEELRDPAIEVTPLRRVRVFGAVRNPGYYYADPTITVSGAVLLAGGATADGNDKRIDLLRNGAQIHLAKAGGAFREDPAVQSGDEVTVPERSWAARNMAFVTSMVTGIALVIAAVIR